MKNKSREIIATNMTKLMDRTPSLNSQAKLSAKSGVAQATIGRILRQEVSASVDTLEDIARAFGKCVSDLVSLEAASGESQPVDAEAFLRIYGNAITSLPLKELHRLTIRLEDILDEYLPPSMEVNGQDNPDNHIQVQPPKNS